MEGLLLRAVASTAPDSVVPLNGEVTAVLALPYADETAVPIDENWPLTVCAVDASVPETPFPAPEESEVGEPAVRVGQIEGRLPGVEVQPVNENAKPPTPAIKSDSRQAIANFRRVVFTSFEFRICFREAVMN